MNATETKVPEVCATCSKFCPDEESIGEGYCIMWSQPTVSTASCTRWQLDEEK